MTLQKLKFLNGVTKFENAVGGYSEAQKFLFEKDGKKYFIKIGKFEVRNDLEKLLSRSEIPHPKIVEFGKYDDVNNYIIEDFAEGIPLKFKLDDFDEKFIYEFGFCVGEKYRNLRKIFPDKPLNDEAYDNYMNHVDQQLERLTLIFKEYKNRLSKSQISFLEFMKNYLNDYRKLVKNSVMVFGHTDVKPSNFLINDRDIIVIDFQHTDYKELSLSLLWTFCRDDFKDDKNYAFANGYLDGLFNFDIPENFLMCCNYTYIFNMCKHCCNYIEKEEFNKLEKLINHIIKFNMKNGIIQVDKNLVKVARIDDFPMLKDFYIYQMKGSYSPDNLTFKCENGARKYFLKIMKTDEKHLNHILNNYQIMQDCGITISAVCDYGECKNLGRFWVLYNFIDYPEMCKFNSTNSFEEGMKYGKIVACELKKLKGVKSENFKTYDKNKLYEDLISMVDFIFENHDKCEFILWNRGEVVAFIKKFINSFDNEPIDLIHGDVKFGNILFDKKEKIVIVDNESLIYSYDIMNFYYNILSKFDGSQVFLYQGFVNGFLKIMNEGRIPQRYQGQVKLLLLARLLREAKNIKNNVCDVKRIETLNHLCQKYIEKNEKILWLN